VEGSSSDDGTGLNVTEDEGSVPGALVAMGFTINVVDLVVHGPGSPERSISIEFDLALADVFDGHKVEDALYPLHNGDLTSVFAVCLCESRRPDKLSLSHGFSCESRTLRIGDF